MAGGPPPGSPPRASPLHKPTVVSQGALSTTWPTRGHRRQGPTHQRGLRPSCPEAQTIPLAAHETENSSEETICACPSKLTGEALEPPAPRAAGAPASPPFTSQHGDQGPHQRRILAGLAASFFLRGTNMVSES